ncbi:MAG: serine/threonine-protein phosphatase [Streptosporangiales bacterium]|nr:serine/threonine-protein phosphatase [Streptosporangiales bacterium]
MTLALRYAARSDVGLLREGNEDSAYAGPRLLAVADGMGGHAHGEVASAVAIATLAPLDEDVPGADLLDALEHAVREANETLHRMVESDSAFEGMGTTLTAMLWSGARLAVCHVGDSRAYLLRGGELHQITHDHTLVQSLIDEGRISEEEAASHPQRSLLLRALDGRGVVEPDLSLREAQLGDRYLLCSDGLSGVVSEDTLAHTLLRDTPEEAVYQLIELANRGGGPDNITCVVADIVDTDRPDVAANEAPVVAGAAANAARRRSPAPDTSAGRAAALTQPLGEEPPDEPEDEGAEPRSRGPRRWPIVLLSFLVFVALIAAGGYGAWRYAQSQYYVGGDGREVLIYRGISQKVAGRDLSRVHEHTGVALGDLPTYERQQVEANIEAGGLSSAQQIVERLRQVAAACARARTSAEAAPSPTESAQRTGKNARRAGNTREDETGGAAPSECPESTP